MQQTSFSLNIDLMEKRITPFKFEVKLKVFIYLIHLLYCANMHTAVWKKALSKTPTIQFPNSFL